MCGFICYKGFENISINSSLNKIKHRGPDSSGVYNYFDYNLGFRRLSIIDLSEKGNQPYSKPEDSIVLLFNGEIYNYKILREQLKRSGYNFDSDSDTEVVYYSYMRWGEKCFEKFEGMFSILIFNSDDLSVTLARDHLGIKPLYYFFDHQKLICSSELKVFSDFVQLKLDDIEIFDYLRFGYLLGENTLYKGVCEVAPGSIVYWNGGDKLEKKTYFDLANTFDSSDEIELDEVYTLLKKSSELHLLSDVPVGIQLSGGIDSSLLAALANNNNITGFSVNIDHEFLSEKKYQDYVIDLLGISSYSTLYNQSDLMNISELKDATYYYDYPLHHPNILASDKINALAKLKGYSVLLSGDGADEFFAGYNWHTFAEQSPKQVMERSSFVHSEIAESLIQTSTKDYNSIEKHLKDIAPSNRQLYFDQRYYIQKWFHRQDRSGMRSSVEIRVPFATISIVEAMNAIPVSAKTANSSETKYLLKKIASNFFDSSFVYRKKVGFTVPINDWILHPKNRSKLKYELMNEKILDQNFINSDYLMGLFEQNELSYQEGRALWMILMISFWMDVNNLY